MDDAITLECLSGAALLPHLDAVAALRIAVFRDWPYLYEGDVGYEREYLAAYTRSADSVVVLAAIMVATRKVDWYQVGARIGNHSTPTSL